MVDTQKVDALSKLATAIRRRDLQMIYKAKLGHIGGDLSATDILVTLYFSILRVDPHAPNAPDRDRFILSKGHTSFAPQRSS
jgi:transketolase